MKGYILGTISCICCVITFIGGFMAGFLLCEYETLVRKKIKPYESKYYKETPED